MLLREGFRGQGHPRRPVRQSGDGRGHGMTEVTLRRVVVTGPGIVSSIGNDKEEVAASLKAARSGIVLADEYKELGFRSHVPSAVRLDTAASIDHNHPPSSAPGAGA